MRGRTRVHIPICVELLQRHCVQNICKGGLVLGRRWVQGTARTIGAVGVGAVEVIGRRSSSEMCLSSTRKRWRWTGLLLVERFSARAGAKDALARHQPHLEVVAPWISPWTGGTPRRAFGWLAGLSLASQLTHRNTVHVQTEQYFSLTTISRNSILAYFSVLPNRPKSCCYVSCPCRAPKGETEDERPTVLLG